VLNADKFQFAQRSVDFAGIRVSSSTIEPLPKYLDAIRDFPSPISTTDIRSWFGLVNQVTNYAQLRDIMAPFKPFLSPRCKFHWSLELEEAFYTTSKEAIVEAIRKGVEIFDIHKRTCLRPDWSRRGIGYFLLQQHCSCPSGIPECCPGGWHITLAGSRFLSSAEERYAAIEGEVLAVAWDLEQTRYFTQGCDNLVVITDHKPLVKIFGDRTLDEISNSRLFRLKQRTLQWRFDIKHLPGKTNLAADAT
jgi:GNAT superfamily N-acetyltransferase